MSKNDRNVIGQMSASNANVDFCTVPQIVDLMKKNWKNFFTVAFTKRSDNSIRVMNARLGVKKGLKGSGNKYHNDGLLGVYDMTKKDYRMINVSGIRWLKMKGKTYVVTG